MALTCRTANKESTMSLDIDRFFTGAYQSALAYAESDHRGSRQRLRDCCAPIGSKTTLVAAACSAAIMALDYGVDLGGDRSPLPHQKHAFQFWIVSGRNSK